jgi:hypothetical protein
MPVATKTATILAGQSLSDAIDISGALQVFIVTPAVWTPANMTFQASCDAGATFYDFFTQAGEERMFGMGGRLDCVSLLDISDMPKSVQIKLRSGVRRNPVPQAQDAAFPVYVVT